MATFIELYRKHCINTLVQTLTRANTFVVPCTLEQTVCTEPRMLEAGPLATPVVMWDLYLPNGKPGQPTTFAQGEAEALRPYGTYVGSLRLEFGEWLYIDSTLSALKGIEAVLQAEWVKLGVLAAQTSPFELWAPAAA